MARDSDYSDPFAPVQLDEVTVAGESVSTKIAVRVADDQGKFQLAGIVGKNYQLMPNRKVRDIAEDIMSRAPSSLGGFKNLKTLFDGKHYVDYFHSNNPVTVVKNGTDTELKLGLMVWNAYDGSRKTGFEVYALNPFCTNQYHSRNRFGFFAWRHTPNEQAKIDVEDALHNVAVGVQNIIAVAPVLGMLKKEPLTIEMVQEHRKALPIPPGRWGYILEQLDQEEKNRFGLFQAMTHVTSHKMTGMSAISLGSEITEHFLKLPGEKEVIHHTTAAEVLASKA